MTRYLARGIGIIVGLPAGPAGVLFGFLIGALVDQYIKDAPADAALDRYLTDPARERSNERALFFATAALAAIVIGPAVRESDERARYAATLQWPGRRTVGMRLRAIRRASMRLPLLAPEPIVEDLARRRRAVSEKDPVGAFRDLVETIVTATAGAGHETVTVNSDLVRLIETLAAAVGVDLATVPGADRLRTAGEVDDCRILGVTRDVTPEELKSVYRRLVAQMHPDTGSLLEGYQQAELNGVFIRIRDAYDRVYARVSDREQRVE